jgi:uncharacterized protein (DUF1778 family)
MAADARLEVRVSAATKSRLTYAAALIDQPVSEFVRSAVEEYLERVLEEHLAVTRVPAEVFDALIDSLDDEPVINDALSRGAQKARRMVRRA